MKLFKKIFDKSENRRNCFPRIDEVFHKSRNLDLVFFPLVSINLNEVVSNRNELVHFVDIWNNGDIEDYMFNDYRTRYIIKFQLEDSKYYYHGDEKAFPKFSTLSNWNKEADDEFNSNKEEYTKIPTPAAYKISNRRIKEVERENIDFDYFLYVDQKISYLINKKRFKENGKLITHKSLPIGYEYKNHEPFRQIGGKVQWEQRDMTPLDKNGNPLTFIGHVKGFNYMQNGSDNIYLFLNEETNEVIQIFQYG